MRCILLTALLLAVAPLSACLNDRDSRARAEQSIDEKNTNPDKGFPNFRDVLSGRFDRFPPAFFQKRIEFSEARIAKDVGDFEAYDDMAVAYDRIGNDDKAIEVIEKKREILDARRKSTAIDVWKEHDYAYYANLGTFVAHRWFKRGAKAENIDEMKRGRDLIARAIQIKPDAHLGREKYQLMAMDWILGSPKFDGEELPSLLGLPLAIIRHGKPWGDDSSREANKAAAGLAGLIVLGAAWESIDVTYALATMLYVQGEKDDACFAILRCIELAGIGRTSIAAGAPTGRALEDLLRGALPLSSHEETAGPKFKEARTKAEAWVRSRNEYLLRKIDLGLHPDTQKDFWLEFYGGGGLVPNFLTDPFVGGAFGLVLLLLLGGILILWFQSRRKHGEPPLPKHRTFRLSR